MTSVLQALAAKQIEVETRNSRATNRRVEESIMNFPYNYMYFEELLPESFSTEL